MTQNKSVEEVVEDFINRFSVNIADVKTTKQLAKFWLRTTLMERDQTSQEREREYQELIMAVGNKHEGETRHQTALRYIKQAEQLPLPATTNPNKD